MPEPKIEHLLELSLQSPNITVAERIQLLTMLKDLTEQKRQQRHDQKMQTLKFGRPRVIEPFVPFTPPVTNEVIPAGQKVENLLKEWEKSKAASESPVGQETKT